MNSRMGVKKIFLQKDVSMRCKMGMLSKHTFALYYISFGWSIIFHDSCFPITIGICLMADTTQISMADCQGPYNTEISLCQSWQINYFSLSKHITTLPSGKHLICKNIKKTEPGWFTLSPGVFKETLKKCKEVYVYYRNQNH